MIPIVAIAAGAAVKVAKMFSQSRPAGTDPQMATRLAALEDDAAALRQELSEVQERLDFTERLLTQQRSDQLPPKT
jgi:hypothetical protein